MTLDYELKPAKTNVPGKPPGDYLRVSAARRAVAHLGRFVAR